MADKSKFPGMKVPSQGDHDETPSGLGFSTTWGGSEGVDEEAPVARKAGLPGISYKGTFNMLNAIEDEPDPY